MARPRTGLLAGVLLLLLPLFLACGDDDAVAPTPSPDQGALATEVAAAVAATLTAQPLATPAPTATSPPSATPAPPPTHTPPVAPVTATPTATSAATATAQPAPTATSVPPSPTATATPTATPTVAPTPTPALPALGDQVGVPPLAEWEPASGETWNGFVSEDGSYHLRIDQPCAGIDVCGTTDEALPDAGRVDLSVAVDVRVVEAATPTSSGCVALGYRDPDGRYSEFWFCLMADGRTFALFVDGVGDDDPLAPEFLLMPALRTATAPAGEWNRLQIIVHDGRVWFLLNERAIRSLEHTTTATRTPVVGIHTGNTGDPPVEFAFRDLEVRLVE